MKHTHSSSGFILIITLSIITLSIILITYISNKSSSYIPFTRLSVDRPKAYELALGGLQLALSQLATAAQGTSKAKPTELDHAKELLITLLPTYNQWQTFKLNSKTDGFDGELKICITSESGKININQIYDFKNKKFVGEGDKIGDYKKIMQAIFERIPTFIPLAQGLDLFKGFEKFLKERQYEVQDVTELLSIKEFDVFKRLIFYEPSTIKTIYLTDIFTVWTDKKTIEPWLLSDSLVKLFNFQSTPLEMVKEKEDMRQTLLKGFALKTEWTPISWNSMMKPLYGVQFQALPEFIMPLLGDSFEATTFSVLSYAKVGTMTQRLLAIVQRDVSLEKDATSFGVKIKKLYWL